MQFEIFKCKSDRDGYWAGMQQMATQTSSIQLQTLVEVEKKEQYYSEATKKTVHVFAKRYMSRIHLSFFSGIYPTIMEEKVELF